MKVLCTLALCFATAFNLIAGEGAKKSDAYYRKAIVGSWKTTIKVPAAGIEINAVDTFMPNGMVKQKGVISTAQGDIDMAIESTWKIEKGYLISELKSVKPAGILKVGSVSKDKIITMNDKEFKYKSEKSPKIQTYTKVKG